MDPTDLLAQFLSPKVGASVSVLSMPNSLTMAPCVPDEQTDG